MTPEVEAWNKAVGTRRQQDLAARKSTQARSVKTLRQPSLHPFRALLDLRKKVDEVRQKFVFGSLEYEIEIAKLPAYKGRGKGGGHRVKNHLAGSRWCQDRSKYKPHQGKTECGRRVFQSAPKWVREEVRRVEELI